MAISMMKDEAQSAIATTLANHLDRLKESQPSRCGHSMERLWERFNAPRTRTLSELESKIRVETLMQRFDSLAWTSNTSIEQLGALRRSILHVQFGGAETDPALDRSLQVNSFQQISQGNG